MSGVLTDNSSRSSGLAKTASGGAGVSWDSSIKVEIYLKLLSMLIINRSLSTKKVKKYNVSNIL